MAPTCSFCGHESPAGVRSCRACGYVFGAEPDGSGQGAGKDGPGHLAHLHDPAPVARSVRRVTVLAGVAGALAAVVGVTALVDMSEALRRLGDATPLPTGDGIPTIAGRADLVAIAEHSLFAGVLVMLGGWAQQVGATRSLLGVDEPARDAGGMLRAFVVPGPNVVTAGRAVRELWSDNAPPGASGGSPPAAVRWFGPVFGAAVAARLAAVAWGFSIASTPSGDGEALLGGAVAAGTRLLWIAALVLAVAAARTVAKRQRIRALRLSGG